jgi:LysR family transcriptional regulator, glycine cleavage system transcriptional activator
LRYRLPPMNALRVFEAAGRHLSFKAAAAELQVTPSAVSHGVHTLEEWLGHPLFARRREGLALTKIGAIYFPAAREALQGLAEGIEALPGARTRGKLTISAAPTFAARILLPHLHKLRQELPDVSVQIDTAAQLVDFEQSDVDLAVRLGHGQWEGLESIHLLTETLVPVCSPALKARLGGTIDLAQAPLIHLNVVSQDWRAWLEDTGQANIDLDGGFKVDSIQLAIAAAVQGLGVCIGRRPLIDAELAAGTLVECGPAVTCRSSYYLVAPPASFRRPEVHAFRSWILAETAGLR